MESAHEESAGETWVDKYHPKCTADLCVNKKKLGEIKEWFYQRKNTSNGLPSNVLSVCGPTGSGKKTAVKILASEVGFDVQEWTAPVPTLWHEHLRQNSQGIPYVSKVHEFLAFLDSMRYGKLIIEPREEKKMFLIDELPLVINTEQINLILENLEVLLKSNAHPVVFIFTEGDSKGLKSSLSSEFPETLRKWLREKYRVAEVTFNHVAPTFLRKVLQNIMKAEKTFVQKEIFDLIVLESQGDVRNAIWSLQFQCATQIQKRNGSSIRTNSKKRKVLCKDNGKFLEEKVGGAVVWSKDGFLDLFHGLGKILYNKRKDDEDATVCLSEIQVKEEYRRPPSETKDPEKILDSLSTEASTLITFLHENCEQDENHFPAPPPFPSEARFSPSVPSFVSEEAVEDMAEANKYLSDGDVMMASNYRDSSHLCSSAAIDFGFSSAISTACGLSVAVRGALFANCHPAPRRFQSFRAPVLWCVEKELRIRQACMDPISCIERGFLHSSGIFGKASRTAELFPFLNFFESSNYSVKCPNDEKSLQKRGEKCHTLLDTSLKDLDLEHDEIEEF